MVGPLELQLRQRRARGHILIRLLDLDRRHNLDPRHLGGLGLSLIVEGDLVVEGRGLSGFLEVSNLPRSPFGFGGPIMMLAKRGSIGSLFPAGPFWVRFTGDTFHWVGVSQGTERAFHWGQAIGSDAFSRFILLGGDLK